MKKDKLSVFHTNTNKVRYTVYISYFSSLFFSIFFFFAKNNRTALHFACMKYDPSEQKTIDVCVALVEAGADYELPDKVIYYVF